MSLMSPYKRNYAPILILSALLYAMISCGTSEEPADDTFYYYINEHAMSGKGVVYVYEPVNNPHLPTEYWHHRFDPGFRGNYLKSELYNTEGLVTQKMVERISRDAARIISLELLYPGDDSLQWLNAQINRDTSFCFGSVVTEPEATYQVEYWETVPDSIRVILTKQRTFDRLTTYAYDGREVPAIHMALTETLETETVGFTESIWRGTEVYAQDIGLVYYKKEISDVLALEYRLTEQIPFSEFLMHNLK